MKLRTWNLIIFAILLIVLDYGFRSYRKSFSIRILAAENRFQPSLLIQIRGDLRISKDGKLPYNPASQGMKLYPGNWLWQKSGGISHVRCAGEYPSPDAGVQIVPKGEKLSLDNLGCKRISKTGFNRTTRGGDNQEIPFIISPRSTAVLTDRPKLRWNAVSGVTNYTVSIEDQRVGKGKIWTTEVSSPGVAYPNQPPGDSVVKYVEVDYPADASPLEPGVDYLVIVTTQQQVNATDTCRHGWEKQPNDPFLCIALSTKDQGIGLGFNLLDTNKAQRVQELTTDIKQEFDGEVQALALAHLYSENNLKMDAIATLETLAQKGNKTAGVYRFLGDLYREIQLSKLAEIRYMKAIELAKGADDLVGQVAAQFGLAEVFAERGFWDGAIQAGMEAKAGYETLGDTKRVEEIEKKLQRWERQRARR